MRDRLVFTITSTGIGKKMTEKRRGIGFETVAGMGGGYRHRNTHEHQIQPEYGDEQADAGRDCRSRLARPNSQARTGTGKYIFSLFS